MGKIIHGKVHGRTIEVNEDLGLSDGQEVELQVRVLSTCLSSPAAPQLPLQVPPGILRSQQGFWRDLPDLLQNKRNLGKWVCYHGEERIGIANSDGPLIGECVRRSIPDDEYDLFIIEPRDIPPWEAEDVEALGPWHFDELPPSS